MSTLSERLRKLARGHDALARRACFGGNAKHPAHPGTASKRQHHEQAARDLDYAAALYEKVRALGLLP